MKQNYICLLTIYSILLNIYGHNWYSAGLTELGKNKENYKLRTRFPDTESKYLPTQLVGGNQFINRDTLEETNSKNTYEDYPVQGEVVNEFTTNPQESISRNKTKISNISYNNTIENVNVFRRRPIKYRRCPPIRPAKRKHIKTKPRDKKFLEVFQIVEFEHEVCVSSSGLEGKCLHEYECKSSGGAPMGDCADGYGTCCVMQLSCGDQSDAATSWFTNPGYPSVSTERLSCAITLDKTSSDIAQIRFDFVSFELQPPSAGTCEQDQFVISGHNINSFVPILCGVNNGQHIYVEVNDVVGPIYISIQTVTSDSRLFAMKITQLTSSDPLAAPSGCLQYFRDIRGNLESFNYQDISNIAIARNPSYLNNLNYAMCIKRGQEMCSITYNNEGDMQIMNYDFDGLPIIPPGQAGVEIFNCPNDWLLTAAARLCGERLNDGSILQDFSLDAPVTDIAAGPIIIWFKSDAAVSGRGFKLQYQQNSCTNHP